MFSRHLLFTGKPPLTSHAERINQLERGWVRGGVSRMMKQCKHHLIKLHIQVCVVLSTHSHSIKAHKVWSV